VIESRSAIVILFGILVGGMLGLIPAMADDDSPSPLSFLNGLHKLDNAITDIQEKSFSSWAVDKLKDAVSDKIPDLFGSASDTVRNAQTAGRDLYEIDSKGMNVVEKGFSAIDANSDPSIVHDAVDAQDKFWDWLGHDKAPAMMKDVWDMVAPDSLKAIAEKAQTFYNDAEWAADKSVTAEQGMGQTYDALKDKLKDYFSRDAAFEPGSKDAAIANSVMPDAEEQIAAATKELIAESQRLGREEGSDSTKSDSAPFLAQEPEGPPDSGMTVTIDGSSSVAPATPGRVAAGSRAAAGGDDLASQLADWDNHHTKAADATTTSSVTDAQAPAEAEDLEQAREAADKAEHEAQVENELSSREARVEGAEQALQVRAAGSRAAPAYAQSRSSQGGDPNYAPAGSPNACPSQARVDSMLQSCLPRLHSVSGSACQTARAGSQCMREALGAAAGCPAIQSQLRSQAQSYEATARSICPN
jgi:hypothetical protein